MAGGRKGSLLLLALVVTALVATASGCGPRLQLPGGDDEANPPPANGENGALRPDLDLDALDGGTAPPGWSLTFQDAVSTALSPAGDRVAVVGAFPAGRWRSFTLQVFNRDGSLAWQNRFEDGTYRSGWVQFLANPRYLAVGAFYYAGNGVIHLFTCDGELVWKRPVRGPSEVAMPPAGDRLALIDHGAATLALLTAAGAEVAIYPVGADAAARFVANGDVLLARDRERVLLVDGQGQCIWQYHLATGGLRDVAIAGDGSIIAATTGDSDSSLYAFDARGQLVWRYVLFPGGSNQIAFSPAGGLVAVYDVGRNAGLYVFRAATGELLWRVFIKPSDGVDHALRDAFFVPGRGVVAEYVTLLGAGQEVREEHDCVLFREDGTAAWSRTLGMNVDVHLNADASTAVVASAPIVGQLNALSTTVRFIDFGPLLPPVNATPAGTT